MNISFKNKELERICMCESALQEHFGEQCGDGIALSISVLMAYERLADVPTDPPDSRQTLSDGNAPSFSVDAGRGAKIYFRPDRSCGVATVENEQSLMQIKGIEIFEIKREV